MKDIFYVMLGYMVGISSLIFLLVWGAMHYFQSKPAEGGPNEKH